MWNNPVNHTQKKKFYGEKAGKNISESLFGKYQKTKKQCRDLITNRTAVNPPVNAQLEF